MGNWFKSRLSVHSIRFKVSAAVLVGGLLLLIFAMWLFSASMSLVVNRTMDGRLASDIKFLRDELGEYDGKTWSERDGALYIGDTLIGDGTPENANEAPFFHCAEVSGTFFYTCVRTYNDDELIYVESGGYQQGHYMRTAGTTRGPNGEHLAGTYIDKKVADILDSSEDGAYSGVANVNGRIMYCRYELLKDADGKTVGAIIDGRSIEEMNALINTQKIQGTAMILAAIVLIFLCTATVINALLRAIKVITRRLARIGAGELPEEPLHLKTKDEMSEIAESVNRMVESLREKERIGAELSLATNIQANMLPSGFPLFPEHDEFDVYATMTPAKEVGGDFYDIFMLDDQNIAIVIADVSGKGVPAALFMVITKTLIKNHAQQGMSPGDVFTEVNHLLCETNDAGLFVTGWMGVLNVATGILTYVNAGHNPPMIKLGDKGFEYLRGDPGFVLAGIDGIRYQQCQLQMQPGDRIFLYTDGVTEAMTRENELYGETRLSEYMNVHAADSVQELLHGLHGNINDFAAGFEQVDDITMLVLDYRRLRCGDDMIEREFEAQEDRLEDVLAFVQEEMDRLECPVKFQVAINIAVEEIFVNIARYAYADAADKSKAEHSMKLGLLCRDGTLTLRFSDRGFPFNPLAKDDPDVTLTADERSIGGLGIFMVKKSMDKTEYRYENGQNIFEIAKRIG